MSSTYYKRSARYAIELVKAKNGQKRQVESFEWEFSICQRCLTNIVGCQKWSSIAALGEYSAHSRTPSSRFGFKMDFVLTRYGDLLPLAVAEHQIPWEILGIVEVIFLWGELQPAYLILAVLRCSLGYHSRSDL